MYNTPAKKKDGFQCIACVADGNRKFCNKHSDKPVKKHKYAIIDPCYCLFFCDCYKDYCMFWRIKYRLLCCC